MKDKKMIFGIILTFLFLLSAGMTYAYFYVTVSGNEDVKDITASTGTLEINYNSGPELIAQEIFPGWTTDKTFTVENTGSLTAFYSINWDTITNTIINDELIMSLMCTGNGCKSIGQEAVGNVEGPFVSGIRIEPGVVHTYTLTLTFLETGSIQNYNQNKVFSASINIEESNDNFDLYGVLVDSSDQPIGGAVLTLHSEPKTTTTDSNGNFVFENVDVDNHTLTATLNEEEVVNDSLVINNGITDQITDNTITKRKNTKMINVKVKVEPDKSIESIEKINYNLSSNWATRLGITKSNIIAIAVETTLESPATYTYKGVTYNKSQNSVDVSEGSNETVFASTYTEGTTERIVMINSRGLTSLPQDSSYIFSDTVFSQQYSSLEYLQAENIDASQVTNAIWMFSGAGKDSTTFSLDLSTWDVSQITNMTYMFDSLALNATTFNLNVSNWDASQVTSMKNMFFFTGYNANSFNLDLSTWKTSQLNDMTNMFEGVGQNATTFVINVSNLDTSNVTSMKNMFNSVGLDCESFSIIGLNTWDVSQVIDMSYMFSYGAENATIIDLDLSDWDTSHVTNMSGIFSSMGSDATTFNLNIQNWDVSNLTSFSEMFSYLGKNSKTLSVNVSNWVLTNRTNMSNFFKYIGNNSESFSLIGLNTWDTSQVTNMSNMFSYAGYNATSWNIGDISDWNTSQVTDMSNMFSYAGYNSSTFDLDLGDWNTTSLLNVSGIFQGAGAYATNFDLDLSNWNTSNVQNIASMFQYAGQNSETFQLNLNDWETSAVTSARTAFSNAGENATTAILNIKNFDLSALNVARKYAGIFSNMPINTQITVGSTETKDWILNLVSPHRPIDWSDLNITVQS